MYRFSLTLFAVLLANSVTTSVDAQSTIQPFKLGTFRHAGHTFVGVVLDDTRVIDFASANGALAGGSVASPTDMKALIGRYNDGIRERIVQIINTVNSQPTGINPGYIHDLNDLTVLPPIMYPSTMMNTALNYTEHALEMEDVRDDGMDGQTPPGIAPPDTFRPAGIWEPPADDPRWNPYMFLKSPTAIIAHGESIQIPKGRTEIDWECELGIVVGRTARHVPVSRAADYIFGYTIEMDVSDRGSRGDTRYGSDWLNGKSHDTFAPMGPFIVPKEFIQDPQDIRIIFSLNGKVMQDASTSLMIHNVFEQIVYASNILTLQPGDVIATGTPAGVGSARNPPIFLQGGDNTSCTYEDVGTLENTVINPAY